MMSYKKGNYLVFFPSFTYLKAIQEFLSNYDMENEVLIQQRKMSDQKRRKLLKLLEGRDKDYLVLGVLGGIFSEGVDFLGDMAIAAFIISPGLPQYNFEREIMKQYFDYKPAD